MIGHLSVDLDSTLFDTTHRAWFVKEARERGEEPDWQAYARMCAEDVATSLVSVVRLFQTLGGNWHVVTSRHGSAYEATQDALTAAGLYPLSQVWVEQEDGVSMHTSKALAVVELGKKYPIVAHIDDWSKISHRVELFSDGAIQGVTVTPPGMIAVWPEEKADICT